MWTSHADDEAVCAEAFVHMYVYNKSLSPCELQLQPMFIYIYAIRGFFFVLVNFLDYAHCWGWSKWSVTTWKLLVFFFNWQKKTLIWLRACYQEGGESRRAKLILFKILLGFISCIKSGREIKGISRSHTHTFKPCLWLWCILQEYLRCKLRHCPGQSLNCIARQSESETSQDFL